MVLNSTRLPESWCSFLIASNSESTSVYYQITLISCIILSLLAPMAVVGNAFILAAIWKNPSFRTPFYVLLANLALTDFCTGLLSQPSHIVKRLGDLSGNIKMFCIAGVIAPVVGYYFCSLTVIVMTIMAVERWLHMGRRSLLTVRRVIILYVTSAVLLIAFLGSYMYNWFHTNEYFSAFIVVFVLGAVLCFLITVFAYFKVYRIIRRHQNQVQNYENVIDIEKYKKSVFTILYILVIYLLSYVPFVCCIVVVNVVDLGSESRNAAVDACTVIVFSSSFSNPLLYCWRIKEIRHSVKAIVMKLRCKKCKRNNNSSS